MKMWKSYCIYNVLNVILAVALGHEVKSFDDTILFKINWPDKSNTELLVSILREY